MDTMHERKERHVSLVSRRVYLSGKRWPKAKGPEYEMLLDKYDTEIAQLNAQLTGAEAAIDTLKNSKQEASPLVGEKQAPDNFQVRPGRCRVFFSQNRYLEGSCDDVCTMDALRCTQQQDEIVAEYNEGRWSHYIFSPPSGTLVGEAREALSLLACLQKYVNLYGSATLTQGEPTVRAQLEGLRAAVHAQADEEDTERELSGTS